MKAYRDIIWGIATVLLLIATCSSQEQNFFQKASMVKTMNIALGPSTTITSH